MTSIVTVADLEWDCTQYLQSLEVPTLYSLHLGPPPQTVCKNDATTAGDPNEVDLDDLDASTNHTDKYDKEEGHAEPEPEAVTCFEDYGVGQLLHHPIVWSYFHTYTLPANGEDRCTTEHVLQTLIDYLFEQKRLASKFSTFAVEDFIAYLCAELSISHPVEAGILIRGTLHAERLALEHVVNNRYTLYVETAKRELVHFNQQMALFQDNVRKAPKKRRKRSTEEETTTAEADLEVDEAAVEVVSEVVEEERGREREEEGSATVVLEEAVEEVCTEVPAAASVDSGGQSELVVHASTTTTHTIATNALPAAATTATNHTAPASTASIADTNIADPTTAATNTATNTATNAATTTNTHNAKRTAPYEGTMNVYLPNGQASVTSTGAFRCGAHSENADTGIRIVENWELQSILPYVNMNDIHNTYGDSVGVSSVDVGSGAMSGVNGINNGGMNMQNGYMNPNWTHDSHYNPLMPPVPLNPYNTNTNNTTNTNTNTNTFNVAVDSRTAGRWGEALIYQYLLSTAAPGTRVNWLNQQEETRACYDFIVHAPIRGNTPQVRASRLHFNQTGDGAATNSTTNNSYGAGNTSAGSSCTTGRESTEYIEVKSTRFADRNMFEISLNEWQFAAADSRVPYHIYRVFSAGDPQRVRLVIIEDVYRKVSEGRLKLCMAV